MKVKGFNQIYLLLLIAIIPFINSCEKVINLDLNKENPAIIIEAPIDLDSTNQKITIKKTVNFDVESNGTPVIDALVTLTDGEQTVNFIHQSNGDYVGVTPIGFLKTAKQYELKVIQDGKTYSSVSICPAINTPLDSIGVYKQKSFGRYNYSIVPLRNENPKGISNWYQFKAKKNGVKINKILIDDDQNLDGVPVTRKPIFDLSEFSPDTIVNDVPKYKIEKDGVIMLQDSVEIELTLVNLEYKVFRYFYNLVLNQGGRQSATPSNPDVLFTNGALGYFSIQKSFTQKKWINTK
jgi:hypothetical protein